MSNQLSVYDIKYNLGNVTYKYKIVNTYDIEINEQKLRKLFVKFSHIFDKIYILFDIKYKIGYYPFVLHDDNICRISINLLDKNEYTLIALFLYCRCITSEKNMDNLIVTDELLDKIIFMELLFVYTLPTPRCSKKIYTTYLNNLKSNFQSPIYFSCEDWELDELEYNYSINENDEITSIISKSKCINNVNIYNISNKFHKNARNIINE